MTTFWVRSLSFETWSWIVSRYTFKDNIQVWWACIATSNRQGYDEDMLENTLVDQVSIAVHSIEKSLEFYQKTLGLKLITIEEVSSEKVKVAILQAGETRIELLEPTSKDSTIAKFLEKKGEGVHHIAFRTDNLHSVINRLRDQRVQIIEPAPRKGSENSMVGFVHPKSTHGVLLELVQRS